MYINLRVTYNPSGCPADIWYVKKVAVTSHDTRDDSMRAVGDGAGSYKF